MKDQTIYREAPAYYHPFLDLVGTDDLLQELERSRNSTMEMMDRIAPEQEHFTYQPGKWTTNQVIRHIIDTERIFAYRALRFSRADATELPGFDENAYIDNLRGLDLRLADLKDEYGWVRGSTIALFRTMTPDMLDFRGRANQLPITARVIGFITVGHNLHHVEFLRRHYLTEDRQDAR